jgi:hypothetical protein
MLLARCCTWIATNSVLGTENIALDGMSLIVAIVPQLVILIQRGIQ